MEKNTQKDKKELQNILDKFISLSPENQEAFVERLNENGNEVLVKKIAEIISKIIKEPTKQENKSIDEKIIDGETHELVQINLTVSSAYENIEEVQCIISDITNDISDAFMISPIHFFEIFYDSFSDFYYLLLTEEPLNINDFFPEGYKVNNAKVGGVEEQYAKYINSFFSKKEFDDLEKKVLNIFKKRFPFKEDSKIISFIYKSKLLVLLAHYLRKINEEKQTFN